MEFGRMADLVDRRFAVDVPPPDLSSLEAWARERMRAPIREPTVDMAAESATRGPARAVPRPRSRDRAGSSRTVRALLGEEERSSWMEPGPAREGGFATGKDGESEEPRLERKSDGQILGYF
jgi:hypothetical protein